MKKLLLAAALAVAPATALSAPAAAQPAPTAPAARPDADPAVWVVRDDDTTIYLFGTFHLLDGRSDWFNDEVRAAFDRSDELVLEFVMPSDPSEMQRMIQGYAVDPSGRPLAQRLPAELNARLARALGEIGLPAAAVDRYEPWFLSMTLGVVGAQRLGITGEHGPEAVLTAAAGTRNLPVSGIETAESQIRMFDSMPEAAQIAQLDQTVTGMAQLAETIGPMMRAWATGDTAAVDALMNGPVQQSPELYQTVFVARNARWTDWIRDRMARPGTVFVAVGAGHLAGRDSVQAMLARHGLRAERFTG